MVSWLRLACLLSIVITGCGRSTTVTGRVTYDGKPVAKGAITFVPADGQGPTCGVTIADGRYQVQLSPGKKIVQIVETRTSDHIPSREELNRAQVKLKAGGGDDFAGTIPPNAEGNNAAIDVKPGGQTIDFSLRRPAAASAAPL
jgi:hypothetical protein